MTELPPLPLSAFRDVKADEALVEHYGSLSIQRSIVDGQRGYTVTSKKGVRCFHYRFGDALRSIMKQLGHGEDRDLIVVGEAETGNKW